MAWMNVPLPKMIYKSADEMQLPGQLGAYLMNGYIDELGSIRKRPGLTEVVDLGFGQVQGLYWWDDKTALIAVVQGQIYKITSQAGTYTNITGDALNITGRVSFATDGSTLVMANGGQMVTYNNTGTTTYMTNTGVSPTAPPQTVSHIAYIDGYLLATNTATNGRIHYSNTNDITQWNTTDIFTAESNPDAIQFLDTRWREVTIFGKEGVDVYYNDGVSPFARLGGGYTERGCIAKDSVQMIEGGWIWVDDMRRIVQMSGRNAQRISTPYDGEIRNLSNVRDGSAITLHYGERAFYILTFPNDDKTFTYDMSTGGWAEWGTWDGDRSFTEFRGVNSAYAKTWDITYVGDESNGKVYKLDKTNFQDNGSNIRTVIRTGHIDHGLSVRKRSNRLRMKIKRGMEGSTNPTISLRFRDSNGAWSNWITKSLGHQGDDYFYIDFPRMGIYRSRQYEIQHYDNSDFILVGIDEDIESMLN